MPNYRSIKIALHSQFDVETIPEYYPAPTEDYIARGITGFVPELVDNETSTCSVYMPVLPGSTFWISYSVSPPVPDGHYFLFKLYINRAHVVSWSTGKEEGWRGKTMFGLYERPQDEESKKRVEKRVLCFAPPDSNDREWKDVADVFDEKACIEIRIHRANGRKRVERELEEYRKTQHASNGKGINLVNAGRAGQEQPKRFYKFALIDPVDQPFATFRYYYRTWNQLRDLGLLEGDWNGVGEENDLSVIEPHEGSVREKEKEDSDSSSSMWLEDGFPHCSGGAVGGVSSSDGPGTDEHQQSPTKQISRDDPRPVETRPSTPGVSLRRAGLVQPRGAPRSKTRLSNEHTDEQAQQRLSRVGTPPQFYRLSVPPSVKLDPPKPVSRPLPSVPLKSDSSFSTSYRPHPAYPVENWTVRTPSPKKSVRESTSTPPLDKRKDQGRSASALLAVLSSTWKRWGT